MSNRLFVILPLSWSCSENDWNKVYFAQTPFGNYHIEFGKDKEHPNYNQWRWGYCFREYHDEDEQNCKSLRDGKKKAQEHWEDRLDSCLEERTQP